MAHRRVGSRYRLVDGYERVYLYHVRKTGGTSLVNAILATTGEDPSEIKRRLAGDVRMTRAGDVVFAAHEAQALASGRYLFGWSHQPAWAVRLPPRTFTVTILRDPAARAISLYRYLADPSIDDGQPFPAPAEHRQWAADGFDAFLERVPAEHLLNQLHMFSRAMDPDDAAARINQCALVFEFGAMPEGLARLSAVLGRPLEERHERRSSLAFAPTDEQLARLRDRLTPEYALLERLSARD